MGRLGRTIIEVKEFGLHIFKITMQKYISITERAASNNLKMFLTERKVAGNISKVGSRYYSNCHRKMQRGSWAVVNATDMHVHCTQGCGYRIAARKKREEHSHSTNTHLLQSRHCYSFKFTTSLNSPIHRKIT